MRSSGVIHLIVINCPGAAGPGRFFGVPGMGFFSRRPQPPRDAWQPVLPLQPCGVGWDGTGAAGITWEQSAAQLGFSHHELLHRFSRRLRRVVR
ncbi:hypothetical protein TNCT6_64090 [Streptomyces sp. 6-11-2]|nr:hypothetical protein TNCT6_64090 [Streptomyces sp. 6-11-2]